MKVEGATALPSASQAYNLSLWRQKQMNLVQSHFSTSSMSGRRIVTIQAFYNSFPLGFSSDVTVF
jgi:hypothetical protein